LRVFPARPFDRVDIDWKIGEKPKITLQASGFFAQHHFLPRRKISTSSPWKQNSRGKRTNWPFPDLKSLAKAIAHPYVRTGICDD
jgi:hypothetical protein